MNTHLAHPKIEICGRLAGLAALAGRLAGLAALAALAGLLSPAVVRAAEAWPGETWQQSTVLTALDTDFQVNLSGAHWNDTTRTLWVCTNGPGRFWALVPDGNGNFIVRNTGGRAEYDAPGDLESLTQAGAADNTVYVLVEGSDRIRRYDVSTPGTARLVNEFDFRPFVPAYNGSAGSEGLTFVPDASLRVRGFVDGNGQPYTSRNGMGGLMFVAHQNGGGIYALDLNPVTNAVSFVGRYLTARTESSGLEFDPSTHHLYVWHNLGSNYVEVTDLSSVVGADGQRRFTTVREFLGPKGGNLEGIAFTPVAGGPGWFFAMDDSNQNGAALMWFKNFRPGLLPPMAGPTPVVRTTEVRLAGGSDDVEQRADGTMYHNSSDLEFVTDAGVQVVGLRFPAVSVPRAVEIVDAHVQFTVDEVTAEATSLSIRAEATGNAAAFTAAVRNLSGRATTAAEVAWTPAAWGTIDAAGAAQQTPSLGPLVQALVDRPDYAAGNAMAFLFTGSGRRTARAYEQAVAKAPRLAIEYLEYVPSPQVLDVGITKGANDVEQLANGNMSADTTDLDLIDDAGAQTIGLRFEGVALPAGAQITSATLQFGVDETSAAATNLVVRGEAVANAAAFTSAANNVSGRRMTVARVDWPVAAWPVAGETAVAQRSPNLSAVLQEIVNTAGFASGNAVVFTLTGAGRRIAEAYEGDASRAARLHIEYLW